MSSRCGGCWTPKAHFAPAQAQPANRIRFKVPACLLFQPRDLQLALLRVTDPSLLITVAGLCPKLWSFGKFFLELFLVSACFRALLLHHLFLPLPHPVREPNRCGDSRASLHDFGPTGQKTNPGSGE